MKESRQKIYTPIFKLGVFSSLSSLENRINETYLKLFRTVGNTMEPNWEYCNKVVVVVLVACKYLPQNEKPFIR